MQVDLTKIHLKSKDSYLALKIKGKKILKSLYSEKWNRKFLQAKVLIHQFDVLVEIKNILM